MWHDLTMKHSFPLILFFFFSLYLLFLFWIYPLTYKLLNLLEPHRFFPPTKPCALGNGLERGHFIYMYSFPPIVAGSFSQYLVSKAEAAAPAFG